MHKERGGSDKRPHVNDLHSAYISGFFGNVALDTSRLAVYHEMPHIDSTEPGFAAVFGLVGNSSFEKSGTILVKASADSYDNLSIIQEDALQREWMEKCKEQDGGQSGSRSYMGTNENRFCKGILMAPVRSNRITIYYNNRLHSAFIPDAVPLNHDPRKGRLTMNMFFRLFAPDDEVCLMYELKETGHMIAASNPWQVYHDCKSCLKMSPGCSMCFSRARGMQCVRDTRNACDWKNSHVRADKRLGGPSCSDVAQESMCSLQSNCSQCTSSGCVWCADVSQCVGRRQGGCASDAAMMQPLEDTYADLKPNPTCQADKFPFPFHDDSCEKCVHSNPHHAWCIAEKKCVPATRYACGAIANTVKSRPDEYATGRCSSWQNFRDCKSCTSAGGAWCP